MGINQASLEDSNGKRIANPGGEQILGTLNRIGTSIEHCILELGSSDDFIQAAGSRDRLLVQYRDSTGMYESARSDLDSKTVGQMLMDAIAGKNGWKSDFEFSLMESFGSADESGTAEASASASGGASRGPGGITDNPERSLKDQLMDTVKKEAVSGVNRLLKKGVKGLFGR